MEVKITSPTFHEITLCRLTALMPEIALVGAGGTDGYCLLQYRDNHNQYAHQSIDVTLSVVNPGFAIAVEDRPYREE